MPHVCHHDLRDLCLLVLYRSHYQIVAIAYSPSADFDHNRQPNEVFTTDRYVPYEVVSNTCGRWRHVCAGIALYCCDCVSDACVFIFHSECAPLLCQAKHMPAQDQLLVYVAVEFAAILFPEDEMFMLGSGGGPNDNPIYTNPTLSYGTAYTYFVICLLDTTPESLNVCVIEPDHWCTDCLRFCCFVCYCVVYGFVCLFHRTHLLNE